jgi:hypothetical protein
MRFNGASWEFVGDPGFSENFAGSMAFAFSGTTPYVAYMDAYGPVTVMKFE